MKKVFTLLTMLIAIAVNSWAEPGDVVTDLNQLSVTKTYVIENLRGRLGANANGFYNLAFSGDDGVSNDQIDNNNDEQRFFIFQSADGEGIYIFSVAAAKFVVPPKNSNGLELSDVAVLITVNDEFLNPGAWSGGNTDQSATEQYRWFLSGYGKYLNLGGGTWKFDTWTTPDPGNRNRFVETATKDTDPADPSQYIGTNRPIRAHLSYEGVDWMEVEDEAVIGNRLSVPGGIKNPLLSIGAPKYNGEDWPWVDDEGYPLVPSYRSANEEILDVYYDSTWGAPFELSTSYADAKWYNMDIRRSANADNPKYINYEPGVTAYTCAPVSNEKDLMMPAFQWAITGDPINGVMLMNRAAGEGKFLQADASNNVVMLDGEYLWEATGVSEGTYPAAFSICVPGTNKFVNELSNAGKLGIWDSSSGRTDAGSLLRFTEAPESPTPLTKVTINATYNGQVVKTATVDTFVDTPLGEVVPGSAVDNGLVDFTYDENAPVTADMVIDIPVTFKLDIALDKSKWYNIDLRDGAYFVNAIPTGDQAHYYPVDAFNVSADDLNSAVYQWAFEGTPYEMKVYNRAYGEFNLARYLDPNNNNKPVASMRDDTYVWNVYASSEGDYLGFALEASDNPGQYVNQEGGAGDNHLLGFWNNRNESGCRLNAVEVAQVADPIFPVNVNYHLIYNGEDVVQKSRVSFSGDAYEMPASMNNPLLIFSFDAEDADGNIVTNVPEGVDNVDVFYRAEWANIFELSTSFADAKWYNMDIRRSAAESKGGLIFVSYSGTAPYPCATVTTPVEDEYGFIEYVEDTDKRAMTNYQWAIIGDPFKGVQVINRAAGEGMTLGVNANNVPEFFEGVYTWEMFGVDKNDGLDVGIALKTPGANNWINQSGGADGSFGLWVNGSGTDDGSILRFSEVPESTKKQAEITFNAIYNGEVIKTATFFAFEGDILGEAVTLPDDWNNGLVDLDYDQMAVVTDGMTVNAIVSLVYDIVLDGSKWYNLEIRDNYWVNTERVNGDGHYMPEDKPYLSDEALATNPYYLWTFLGTPYELIILNAAFPSTMSLSNVPVNDHPWAVMKDGLYKWNAYGFTNEEGTYAFGVEYSDMPGNYINQEGGSGNNRPLGSWNVKFDGGAKLRAIEQPDAQFDGMDNFFDGISSSKAETNNTIVAIYNINGARQQTLTKGLNIVRMADGRTVKMMVK